MASIRKLCKTGLLLDKGSIAFQGTANDTVNYYVSGGELSTERIVDNIEFISPKIKVDKIMFNGTDRTSSKVALNQRTIEISVEGYANVDVECDLSFVIRTLDEVPLVCYQVGHFNGTRDYLKKGPFKIERTVQLPPYVSHGECMADIIIHNPNIEYLLRAPHCLHVEFLGTQLEGCDSIDMHVNGFMGLETKK
jgi:lipopolysaccharide transport system ATP-binding protein